MSVIGASMYIYGGFTQPGWTGRTKQLWRYDTPMYTTDDDGESLIDLNKAASITASNRVAQTDSTGITVGLVLIMVLNVLILGVNVFVCRKLQHRRGEDSCNCLSGNGGGSSSTDVYSELESL